jgi:hypothetical protein
VLVRNELTIIFTEEAVPKIKELILDSYKKNLVGMVQGPYDSLKPENMSSLFEERLNNFEFLTPDEAGISLSCPSLESFNFGEGLSLVGAILNGIPNDYYKISSANYSKYASSEVINMYGTEDYLVAGDNPFLSNFDKESLDKFEFSNTPPIDIMEDASLYIKANMAIWIRRAIHKAEINLKEFLSGAKK